MGILVWENCLFEKLENNGQNIKIYSCSVGWIHASKKMDSTADFSFMNFKGNQALHGNVYFMTD